MTSRSRQAYHLARDLTRDTETEVCTEWIGDARWEARWADDLTEPQMRDDLDS